MVSDLARDYPLETNGVNAWGRDSLPRWAEQHGISEVVPSTYHCANKLTCECTASGVMIVT
jgi:hypothetical protein